MKKIISLILILILAVACLAALSSCTDGEEQETGHNIIVGDVEDENDDPVVPDGETVNDEWELGGVPLS